MVRKTLTVSEEAYRALVRLKLKDESFSKVILRLAWKREKGSLLDYVKSLPPNPELATRLEKVLENRAHIRLRAAGR